MRKTALFSLAGVVILAVFSFFIRRSWWMNALEYVKAPPAETAIRHTETLVVRTGAWETVALVLLGALILLAALAAAYFFGKKLMSAGYALSLRTPSDTPRYVPVSVLVMCTISSLMLLTSAFFLARSGDGFSLFTAFFGLMTAVSVCAVPYYSILRRTPQNRNLPKSIMALSLFPELFMTLLLVALYRDNQTDPVIMRYAPMALAIAFSAMSYYTDAAYVFLKPTPVRTIFFRFCGIVTAGAALADIPRRYRMAVDSAGEAAYLLSDTARRTASTNFWITAGLAIMASILVSCALLFALGWSVTKKQSPEPDRQD